MEIKFHIQSDIEKGRKRYIQCSGKENQTLKEVIEVQKDPVLSCPVNEYVFKANVKGHTEQVIVNPNTLICGWLVEGANIQACGLPESDKKKVNIPSANLEDASKGISNQSLFYINIDREKNSRKITNISYGNYKVKHLCVSAMSCDTLIDALEKDGRFVRPDIWRLTSHDNNQYEVPLETKVENCDNKIFDVKHKTRKRPSNDHTAEIKEEEIDQVSSNSPMSANCNVSLKKIIELAQSRANKLLTNSKHKKLATLIEKKFSKPIDQKKSVWLMEELVSASKNVGRIYVESGRFTGTCFLVTEDVILTNYHVYKDINEDAASSQGNPKVKVSFNHLRPNQTSDSLKEVEVDMNDVRAKCSDENLDYIFLGLKNKGGQQGLGGQISLVDPKNFTHGVVTIIGHPDGREKVMDLDCQIISQHTWRQELLDRVKNHLPLEVNPILTCKEEITSDKYEKKIAYDSTSFDGSSGSPVFDDQGNIIAIHQCGWVDKRTASKCYVMEFSIPMEAIYDHCFNNYRHMVDLFFPRFSMDVDEQD